MLDLERVHGGALRDDFLQTLAKSRNLPLTIAERIERPAQDVLAVDPERQVVGAADGEHAEVAVKHEQGFTHGVHDGLRERPRILDVLEWLNHGQMTGNTTTIIKAMVAHKCLLQQRRISNQRKQSVHDCRQTDQHH